MFQNWMPDHTAHVLDNQLDIMQCLFVDPWVKWSRYSWDVGRLPTEEGAE